MDAERAAFLEALLFAAPDAVIVVDPAGVIESASPPVERLFGYRPAELIGERVEILLPRELSAVHETHRARYATHPVARSMGSGLSLFGRRRDGSTIPVDVSLTPVVLGGEERVGAFVRDATERRRVENVLRYVNEISRQVLGGESTSENLHLIARSARALVSASASWVVVPSGRETLVVQAADGQGTQALVGASLSVSESISARAMAAGQPVWITDMAADPAVVPAGRALGLGPGLYLPMLADEDVLGVLVASRAAGEDPFDASEAQALEVFAAAASIVLSLGSAREELDVLRIVSEHERIARDLHDTVIQRLFALGLSLQGVRRLAEGVVGERIDESVDSIDEVIREIRQTIFELNSPFSPEPGQDIRRRLIDIAASSARQLGFEPRVAFRGDVDGAVTSTTAVHLVAVATEALSNVVRHAGATSVEVVLRAEGGFVELTIADDGAGRPAVPTAGYGLVNMRDRAEKLRGEFSVSERRPSGTLVAWKVPMGA